MSDDGAILFLVTKNYGRMKQFFLDLGLEVKSGPGFGQVTPFLNKGDGCLIVLGALLISLEESTDVPPSGPLYLQIDGLEEGRLSALQGKYSIKKVKQYLYGSDFYRIVPPDGGVVMVTLKAQE